MVQVETKQRLLPTAVDTAESQQLHARAMKFNRMVVSFEAIDLEASERNQARLLPIHEETVELYEAAMRDGAVFPPIVVNGTKAPFVVLDGNHRIRAAINTGFDSAEMLVVTDASKAAMELYTYEANAKHGLPTTVEERVVQGVYLVSLGNAAIDVAKALSISERKLWNAMAAYRSRQRLERLGVASNWSPGQLQRFGSVRSDVVVAPLVRLASAARLAVSDIEPMIVSVNALHTETEQLAFVAEQEAKYAPIIASTAGGAIDLPREVNRLKIGIRMLQTIDPDKLKLALEQLDPALRESMGRDTVAAIGHLVVVAGKFR